MKLTPFIIVSSIAFANGTVRSCSEKLVFSEENPTCQTDCGFSCPDFIEYGSPASLVFVQRVESSPCGKYGQVQEVCKPVQFMCNSGRMDDRFGKGCVTQCAPEDSEQDACPESSWSFLNAKTIFFDADKAFRREKISLSSRPDVVSEGMATRYQCPVDMKRWVCPFTPETNKNLFFERTNTYEESKSLLRFFSTSKKGSEVEKIADQKLPLCFDAEKTAKDPLNATGKNTKCRVPCGEKCPISMKKGFKKNKNENSSGEVYMTTERSHECFSGNQWHVCAPVAYKCESDVIDGEYGDGCVTECTSSAQVSCEKYKPICLKRIVRDESGGRFFGDMSFENASDVKNLNLFPLATTHLKENAASMCEENGAKVHFCKFNASTQRFMDSFRKFAISVKEKKPDTSLLLKERLNPSTLKYEVVGDENRKE